MAEYLSNADFMVEVLKSREMGKCSDGLAKMFMLLVEKSSHHQWYRNYTYIDDMKGHALLTLFNAALKFDPERFNNPHAFFTTCCFRAFSQIKKQELKHRNIRDVLLVENGMEPSTAYTESQTKLLAEQSEAEKLSKLNKDDGISLDDIFSC